MSPLVLDMWRGALVATAMVGGPFIVACLVVGLLTSLVQAATQLQENVLSFAPKLVAVGLLASLAGHWFLDALGRYLSEALAVAARIGGGA